MDLGDKRLDRRAAKVLADLAVKHQNSIPTASEGWAETNAAYRFFQNEKVTAEKVLQPHIDQTMRRMAKMPVALVLQDTTELNYSAKKGILKDAGPIIRETHYGMLLHPQIVVTPEGIHLGILHARFWTRDAETLGQHREYANRDFEQKETVRWRDGYQIAAEAAAACPETQVISIGDREADIFELLVQTGENAQGKHAFRGPIVSAHPLPFQGCSRLPCPIPWTTTPEFWRTGLRFRSQQVRGQGLCGLDHPRSSSR